MDIEDIDESDIDHNREKKEKLPDSEDIPEDVKRKVRQHDGFGCCVRGCGNPIVEYHHIVPRSKDPKDIMLLCPDHHEKTKSKAMTKDEQLFWKNNPYNIKTGRTKGILLINQKCPVVTIGGVQLIGSEDLITVDNESLLSLDVDNTMSYDKTNRMIMSVKLYDSNDQLLVEIKNNEWISGDPRPWDIIAKDQYLLIRRKKRDIALVIDARKYPVIIRADFWRKGQHIRFNNRIEFVRGIIQNSTIESVCYVGARIEIYTKSGCYISPNPKYGKSIIVSEKNEETRLKKGLEAWEQLQGSK